MSERPLLMIPGPVHVEESVRLSAGMPPPSHLDPAFMMAFAGSLKTMRHIWRSGRDAQPLVFSGSGTFAMDMAISNLIGPEGKALVVSTGYFGHRMASMLKARGVEVTLLGAPVGEAPDPEAINKALLDDPKITLATVTHVDTSTGVRLDLQETLRVIRNSGAISVVDGVCSVGGETLDMLDWGAGVVLTASQKALGTPPGLGLMVMAPWALSARDRLAVPPPMSFDWRHWVPIMSAYEDQQPSYFGTPATSLICALERALQGIASFGGATTESEGLYAWLCGHELAAAGMRRAFDVLGLRSVPTSDALCANTLSALYYPDGVGPELLAAIQERGVVVAGGLHPEIKAKTFRVGHMGVTAQRKADLERAVRAIGEGLSACGHTCDVDAAVRALADE